MTHTTYECDCCHKFYSKENIAKVKMPIIAHYETEDMMRVHEMDFCINCANRFTELYYEIAKENGSTGIHAVMVKGGE